ncbi:MAG: hypothetical protein AAFY78_24955 [Cyanobacteria bacterium J06648_16]
MTHADGFSRDPILSVANKRLLPPSKQAIARLEAMQESHQKWVKTIADLAARQPADVVLKLGSVVMERDATAYHDRALLDLEDLENWGQEPELDDDWFAATPAPERCEPNLEAAVTPLPRAPRTPNALTPQVVPKCDDLTEAEAVAAVGVAHVEEPIDVFNRRVRAAFAGRNRVGLLELAEQTGEKPNGLLIRLLLGGWRLEQTEFYGEVEVLCPSLGA